MGTGQRQLPFSPALQAVLGTWSSPLLSAPGSCGMASGFCSPAQLLPGSCSQSPEGCPAALQGRSRCSPQTPGPGAEAEPVGQGPEALPRSSPQSAPQPTHREPFLSMAGAAGGECWVAGRALGGMGTAWRRSLEWSFTSLGPFSHGCRSGPQLPCAEPNP